MYWVNLAIRLWPLIGQAIEIARDHHAAATVAGLTPPTPPAP